jgi:hypothetical protein
VAQSFRRGYYPTPIDRSPSWAYCNPLSRMAQGLAADEHGRQSWQVDSTSGFGEPPQTKNKR